MSDDLDPARGVAIALLLCAAIWIGVAAVVVRWW
jgi:hypothetical protein